MVEDLHSVSKIYSGLVAFPTLRDIEKHAMYCIACMRPDLCDRDMLYEPIYKPKHNTVKLSYLELDGAF